MTRLPAAQSPRDVVETPSQGICIKNAPKGVTSAGRPPSVMSVTARFQGQ